MLLSGLPTPASTLPFPSPLPVPFSSPYLFIGCLPPPIRAEYPLPALPTCLPHPLTPETIPIAATSGSVQQGRIRNPPHFQSSETSCLSRCTPDTTLIVSRTPTTESWLFSSRLLRRSRKHRFPNTTGRRRTVDGYVSSAAPPQAGGRSRTSSRSARTRFNPTLDASRRASQHFTEVREHLGFSMLRSRDLEELEAKQLFFCNLTESDLRSDSPVV